jgi:hypothetical protein
MQSVKKFQRACISIAVIFGVPTLVALAFLFIGWPYLMRRIVDAPAAFKKKPQPGLESCNLV